MKKFWWIAFLVFMTCSLIVTGKVSAQNTTGTTILGKVENGTSGSSLPSSATIILRFHNADQWTDVFQTEMAADGTFVFNDLEKEVGLTYVIGVVYQGVPYHTAEAVLAEGQNPPAIVTIYETTNDRAVLNVGLGYIGFTPENEIVHVVEDYWINNLSDRTYIDVKKFDNYSASMGFALPSDAVNLGVEDPGYGEKQLSVPSADMETFYILPGNSSTEVKYAYDLPGGERFSFERVFGIPVDTLQIALFSDTLGLQGTDLQYVDQSDAVGGHSSLYQINPLPQGKSFTISFMPIANLGLTGASQVSNSKTSVLTLAGSIFVLLLSMGMAYWIWNSDKPVDMPLSIKPLIMELANLERQRRIGAIPEKNYQRKRAELHKKTMEMLEEKKNV